MFDSHERGVPVVSDDADTQLYAAQTAPSHQRPDGVFGDWDTVPEAEWNTFQLVAARTHGLVTPANLISFTGVLVTASGMRDVYKGREERGLAKMAVGRLLDLADGWAAARTQTRSKLGAGVDAFADKGLAAGAVVMMPMAGAVSPGFAIGTAVQQAKIGIENVRIQRAGGEPNPSMGGKYGMFATWAAMGTGVIGKIFEKRGYQRAANVTRNLAEAVGAVSIGLGEQAIQGYSEQRRSLASE